MTGLTAATFLPAYPAMALDKTPKAAPKGKADEALPYQVLNPPIVGDTNRVRFLFSYECPFCRSYHNGLTQWGGSLPKPLAFDSVPLITSENESASAAVLGRLIGQGFAPNILPNYDYIMYGMIQGDPESGVAPAGNFGIPEVLQALVQAGADKKALHRFLTGKGKGIENKLTQQAAYIRTYKLTSTPAVALMGRVVATPDHTQGNPQQFLLLLNGLVSRFIQGGVNAI